jgi:hypothetical protein
MGAGSTMPCSRTLGNVHRFFLVDARSTTAESRKWLVEESVDPLGHKSIYTANDHCGGNKGLIGFRYGVALKQRVARRTLFQRGFKVSDKAFAAV